jgi:hypothetical protein
MTLTCEVSVRIRTLVDLPILTVVALIPGRGDA